MLDERVALAPLLRGQRRGVDPFAVAPDVEVEPFGGNARRIGPLMDIGCVFGMKVQARGVRAEDQRKARRAAHLLVLAPREALVAGGVDAVVGVCGGKRLSEERQLRGVHETHLRGGAQGRKQRSAQEDKSFHGVGFLSDWGVSEGVSEGSCWRGLLEGRPEPECRKIRRSPLREGPVVSSSGQAGAISYPARSAPKLRGSRHSCPGCRSGAASPCS